MGVTCERCGDAPAVRRRGRAAGKVRDPQSRPDSHWFTKSQEPVLGFQVAQFDELGNLSRLVPVEIRGGSLYGMVRENDEVCVAGRVRGGVLRAAQNLAPGAA